MDATICDDSEDGDQVDRFDAFKRTSSSVGDWHAGVVEVCVPHCLALTFATVTDRSRLCAAVRMLNKRARSQGARSNGEGYLHHRLHCWRYRRQLPSPLSPRTSFISQARRRRSQRLRPHCTCSTPVPSASTWPALNGAADVGRVAKPRPAEGEPNKNVSHNFSLRSVHRWLMDTNPLVRRAPRCFVPDPQCLT
jgi:hypothetical protein